MKKRLRILCTVLFLMFVLPAAAEESAGNTVLFEGMGFPSDAEYIDLGELKVSDYSAFETFLDRFPHLKKVDMFETPIAKPEIEELAERYPEIEFGWTMKLAEHTVRTDQTAFSTLHNTSSETHSEEQFSILKYCKNLQALDIGHNHVNDLSFLYDLPHLKVLIVACNITLKDITPIGSLKELQYLEIFKNDINDISCLANCTELVDLNICYNRIRDLTPIYELKKLERLRIYNCNNYSDIPIEKDIVNGLKEHLPDTHIDWTHSSTVGDWREHPRYFELYDFFRTGVFVPFASLEGE